MLATTSIGAMWTACAPDFGTDSVLERFAQVEPSVLIAVDGYRFGGREHDRREAVAGAARRPALASDDHRDQLARARPPSAARARGGLLRRDRGRAPARPSSSTVAVRPSAVDPVLVRHDRPAQGHRPGPRRDSARASQVARTGHGSRAGDRYFFYSSTSWMAWNYLVGGLLHGGDDRALRRQSRLPGPDGQLARRVGDAGHHVRDGFGVRERLSRRRGCISAGNWISSALRTVIPTGSPLPPSGWHWLAPSSSARASGSTRSPAGPTFAPRSSVAARSCPCAPARSPCRWLGVALDVFDADGQADPRSVGEFVVTKPMPSMPVGLWNDAGRPPLPGDVLRSFPGVWRQGDWATLSADGAVSVLGRSDSTINRGGVRMGSAEIYAVVERRPEVADSLVLGVELPDGGVLHAAVRRPGARHRSG